MIDFADDNPIGDGVPRNANRRQGPEYRLSARNGPATRASSNARAHALRMALLESITESNIKEAVGALAKLAAESNLPAIKLLFEYAAGRPAQARDVAVPAAQPSGPSIEELQAAILGALSPHPHAKNDLAAVLDAMARDQSIRSSRQSLRRKPLDD